MISEIDARLVVGAGQIEHHEQVEQHAGAEEREQQPERHVAVVGALHRDGEFRIGEREIDDGAQPVALDLLGDEMTGNLGGHHHAERDPERLAADAAVEAVEEIGPIHCTAAFNPAAVR